MKVGKVFVVRGFKEEKRKENAWWTTIPTIYGL